MNNKNHLIINFVKTAQGDLIIALYMNEDCAYYIIVEQR